MKNFQSEINRIVPATLPALLLTLRFRDAFLAGVCVGVGCWVTIIFFRLTRNLFPKILLEVAFVLWLIALAQMMWYWKELSPYWVISLFLLAFNEVLKGAATPHFMEKSFDEKSYFFGDPYLFGRDSANFRGSFIDWYFSTTHRLFFITCGRRFFGESNETESHLKV